jgi:2-polyprenyl-3-methyl-5-hydroxy-6-metoxy-1,4-benzoquinol methylase
MNHDEALLHIINNQINSHQELYNLITQQKNNHQEYDLTHQLGDIRELLIKNNLQNCDRYELETDFPVAIQSNDHIYPRGTKFDNTRHPRFVRACENAFPNRKLSVLDLGCAGGGIVYDFIHRGHNALGLEGSDYSKINQRAEWRVIPDHLKTCDITKPFKIFNNKNVAQYDVVCMWEVLEHIHEADQEVLFNNIAMHIKAEGFFIGSIALHDDIADGISFHPTLHSPEWWSDRFEQLGFRFLPSSFMTLGDNCRGVGNGIWDSNFKTNPEMGFHFIAQKISFK